MNNIVCKYILTNEYSQMILLPFGAEILYFGQQDNNLCLWVRVNNQEMDLETRTFMLRRTGQIDAVGKYIGTSMIENNQYTIHCFELLPVGSSLQ